MSEACIKLDGVVNIAKADALYHELENVIKSSSSAVINVDTLQRVDTAVLQLLTTFFKRMSELELDVSWDGCSEELQAAARLLGLEQVLNLLPVDK